MKRSTGLMVIAVVLIIFAMENLLLMATVLIAATDPSTITTPGDSMLAFLFSAVAGTLFFLIGIIAEQSEQVRVDELLREQLSNSPRLKGGKHHGNNNR